MWRYNVSRFSFHVSRCVLYLQSAQNFIELVNIKL